MKKKKPEVVNHFESSVEKRNNFDVNFQVETRTIHSEISERKPESRNKKSKTRNSQPEIENSKCESSSILETRKFESRNNKIESKNNENESRNSDTKNKNNKNGRERDRGVEVYMETVRQRTTVRDKQILSTDIFQRHSQPEPELPDIRRHHSSAGDLRLAMDTSMLDPDQDASVGLPSVRKLLARFEHSPVDISDNCETSRAVTTTRVVRSSNNNVMPSAHNHNKHHTTSVSKTVRSETKHKAPSPSFRAVERKITNGNNQVLHNNNTRADDDGSGDDSDKALRHWDPQFFVRNLYKVGVCDLSDSMPVIGQLSTFSALIGKNCQFVHPRFRFLLWVSQNVHLRRMEASHWMPISHVPVLRDTWSDFLLVGKSQPCGIAGRSSTLLPGMEFYLFTKAKIRSR